MGPETEIPRVRRLSSAKEGVFPRLATEGYCVTSDEDWVHNCVAFAVGRINTRWWPPVAGEVEGVDWPRNAPVEETLAAFVAALETEGYVPCDGLQLEVNCEKLAIFVDVNGAPTHIARQLAPSGEWTSKLGAWEDIRHVTLAALEGDDPAYGKAVQFLKRTIREPFKPECLPAQSQNQ